MWLLIMYSLQVSANVNLWKPRICIASKLREVRRTQFLLELLPVLKRFFSQTLNWPGQTAGRYARWNRWEWAKQHYLNANKNMCVRKNAVSGTTNVPCPSSPAMVPAMPQYSPRRQSWHSIFPLSAPIITPLVKITRRLPEVVVGEPD